MMTAKGEFSLQLEPQDDIEFDMGRMTIDKRFSGDLTGESQGQMLSFVTKVQGSAGYVAIEQVSGTLQGRKGSFVLQHTGTMEQGAPEQSVVVVPDSGTEQLEGLRGTMTIDIKEGKHYYKFEYSL